MLTKLQIPGPYLEILICRNEVGLNNFLFFLLGALQGMRDLSSPDQGWNSGSLRWKP